ncbi:pyruvate dehydrogenase (acetyl-transferring) kinase, mitochondrial [Tanacetum coccineum]
MAYCSSDTVTEADFLHSISVYLCFLSPESILLIVYPLFQLFKTLSLDESRLTEFNLFSDLEENSEEEVAETMAETIEQYMSKTRADYGSGELRDNTFSSSDHEDTNEHIEKVLEIVDLFHVPNITQDQIMLQVFPMSLTGAASLWLRNKPFGSIKTWEDLKTKFLSKYCPPARTAKKMEEINNFQQEPNETLYQAWERFKELLMKCPQHYLTEMQEVILFYNGLEVPTRQILDSKGDIPTKIAADTKVAIQEMDECSQKWHNRLSRTRSTETSDGLAAIQAQLNNLGREIKKVNEKVYAAQVGCELCKGPHYTKDCPLKEEGKTIEEAYYTQFGAPFQQGKGYRAASPGIYQRNNANPSYQERRQSMEESRSKFMSESVKRHEENSNMIKEIRSSMDASIKKEDLEVWMFAIRKGASIKTLEIQIGQMSKNSKLMFKTRQTTILFPSHLNDYYCEEKKESYRSQFLEAYSYGASHINNSIPQKEKDSGNKTVKYLTRIAENILVGIGKFIFPIDFIILDMPEDVKVPLILRRPFLSTAYAKIDVLKRKITLRVGDEKIVFKSIKPASSLIKRVYMLSLRERMELDLEARLMGETLVLNRSLDPLYGDYIELNDLNVPLELRRDQVDDLMPTIKEGEIIVRHMIEEVKVRNANEMVRKFFGYPSDYNQNEKNCIDCAYNVKFSYMIGFEFIHANFFPNLPINVMSKKFYNSTMKEKIKFRGRNKLGNWANVPIFIGNFYVLTNFIVVEDMDPYLDEGMGEVVVREPFCKVSYVETKSFDGIITIYDKGLRWKEIDKVGEVSTIWNSCS